MKTTVADWSSLPRDLLVDIAKLTLMASVESFMAFRSTCSSWNEAAREEECTKIFRWPRVPFLMIPGKAECYSLSRKKSYFLKTPLPDGESRNLIESRFGWILTLETSGKADLLHPFSEEWIQLPNYNTLPGCDRESCRFMNYEFMRRSVLSANPSETSDYVLSVITYYGYMAFWRPGNQNWTKIESSCVSKFLDLIFFSVDRKFYAVDLSSNIWVWDPDMDNGSAVRVTVKKRFRMLWFGRYLVESSAAELLMLGADSLMENHHFQVYRLDFNNGVWERMTSLKDAIFVGNSASFSIFPDYDDPVIRSNCIYLTDDYIPNKVIYNLEDGSIQPFPEKFDHPSSVTSFPVWICPSSLPFMASLGQVPRVPYLKKVLTFLGCVFV